jgi:hypothetical protein
LPAAVEAEIIPCAWRPPLTRFTHDEAQRIAVNIAKLPELKLTARNAVVRESPSGSPVVGAELLQMIQLYKGQASQGKYEKG